MQDYFFENNKESELYNKLLEFKKLEKIDNFKRILTKKIQILMFRHYLVLKNIINEDKTNLKYE